MNAIAVRPARESNAIRPNLFIVRKTPATDWLAFDLDCHRMTRGRVRHVDVLRLRVRQIDRDVDPTRAAQGNQFSGRSISFTVKQDRGVRRRLALDLDKDELHQEFLRGGRISEIAAGAATGCKAGFRREAVSLSLA